MRWIALLTLLFTVGCTHAGPFVTNLAPAGGGRVNVEKYMVEFNMFLGTMSESDCQTQTIQLNTR